MAFNYDFNITKGSSVSVRLTVKDETNAVLNLSGYSISGFVKEKYSDASSILNMNPTIPADLAASGIIDINITAANTALLSVNQYVYDVEIYKDSKTEKIINGYVNVYPEVTR